ncbi:MAG: sugar transferase [Lentisphaeria bacterium]
MPEKITIHDNELILRALQRRMLGGRRHNFKMLVWNLTIALSNRLKRYFDFFVSLFGIILLSPFLILMAILIKLDSKGPIIYQQIRVGQYGRHFNFLKFRSMCFNADTLKKDLLKYNESVDGVLFKMKNDPRVTRVGRLMRKFSIDELPQLFNVLLGDMSLVGPRPPLPSEVKKYTLEDRKRLNVCPGITCIWQTSGRSETSFQEQVELDKEYIASKGLLQDLWILFKTIPAIFIGRGAY